MPPWFPLIGEHELTIDDKGRLLVPAEVRKRLETFGENDVLVLVNMAGRGFLYPEKYHLARLGTVKIGIVPSTKEQMFLRAMFSTSMRLQWDKQGRILLPPKTIASLKLERETTLACAGDHLELWNRPDWAVEQQRIQEKMTELFDSLPDQLGASMMV
ncbi:MAG TPA: hypothetical protein VGB55_06395 [Tepidisphaeraceae bacterium]|jgi:MraZ protein